MEKKNTKKAPRKISSNEEALHNFFSNVDDSYRIRLEKELEKSKEVRQAMRNYLGFDSL